eukprot:CAMPEP_0204245930 /NCGR_PEP_ID=MMETSP0361-20130328/97883_1 /ASSEMBLY_ACC=CAM_ASM_000343 /TAXON_ID=268821 /ORGANISM="Scrippsiella Hangoei, Strain SHTV-5" /LENGTH=71 /DNA_ID=CAMNT_0051219141 /DNA_START=481 /DNA_END=696 /DNA_ORIENTATION=-
MGLGLCTVCDATTCTSLTVLPCVANVPLCLAAGLLPMHGVAMYRKTETTATTAPARTAAQPLFSGDMGFKF